jgi:alpha-galactosidase
MDVGHLKRAGGLPVAAGTLTRRLGLGLVWALLAVAVLSAGPATAAATTGTQTGPPASPRPEPTYAPYMGVNTWYGFGAGINQQTIVQLVNATIDRGLKAAGYRYIWLDAGWWNGQRDANGNIILDPSQWPQGMKWLTHYIHSRGLLAGIYTDMGVAACRNGGSLGHYQRDIDQFAAWGFDAVKGDFCGAYSLHLSPRTEYTRFARDIQHDRPHRRMILYVGNGDTWSKKHALTAMDDWAWAPKVAAMWRTWDDLSWPHGITWKNLLRNIDADASHPAAAGHGHWNDPDYLAPALLPPPEAQAQLTMWTILAAPLMLSANVSTLPASTIKMVTNREALAISQDRLGVQGTVVYRRGSVQVWAKPLAHGSRAVAVLNRGLTPGAITFSASRIGLAGQSFRVLDIWHHRTSRRARTMRFRVPPTSALLLRVSPA